MSKPTNTTEIAANLFKKTEVENKPKKTTSKKQDLPKKDSRVGQQEKENISDDEIFDTHIRILMKTSEKKRMVSFVENPLSGIKSLSDLTRTAIHEYLDKKEPILDLMEKEVAKVKAKME